MKKMRATGRLRVARSKVDQIKALKRSIKKYGDPNDNSKHKALDILLKGGTK